jgi:hypothetical protein
MDIVNAALVGERHQSLGRAANAVNSPATPIAMTEAAGFLPDCLSALAAGPDWVANPDLASIERLAPHIFVLECEAGGPPLYRCAGSAIQDALGFDPRGRAFYENWDDGARLGLQPYFDRSAECHWAIRLSSVCQDSDPHPDTSALLVETVLIPVLSDDPDKSCFIGISLMHGNDEAEPRAGLQHLRQVSYLGEGGPVL